MIGLTAGLVIEGHTGKNILAQVKNFSAFVHKHKSNSSCTLLDTAVEYLTNLINDSFFFFLSLSVGWLLVCHYQFFCALDRFQMLMKTKIRYSFIKCLFCNWPCNILYLELLQPRYILPVNCKATILSNYTVHST